MYLKHKSSEKKELYFIQSIKKQFYCKQVLYCYLAILIDFFFSSIYHLLNTQISQSKQLKMIDK